MLIKKEGHFKERNTSYFPFCLNSAGYPSLQVTHYLETSDTHCTLHNLQSTINISHFFPWRNLSGTLLRGLQNFLILSTSLFSPFSFPLRKHHSPWQTLILLAGGGHYSFHVPLWLPPLLPNHFHFYLPQNVTALLNFRPLSCNLQIVVTHQCQMSTNSPLCSLKNWVPGSLSFPSPFSGTHSQWF